MSNDQNIDVSKLTPDEREKISRTARRSVSSEVTLIFAAGGSLLAVATFMLAMPAVIELSSVVKIRPMALWILISFSASLA